MAAEEILAIDAGAASSEDIIIEPGESLAVAMKGPGRGAVNVEIKDDNDNYHVVDVLKPRKVGLVLIGPGTYRFSRVANGRSAGVFSAQPCPADYQEPDRYDRYWDWCRARP